MAQEMSQSQGWATEAPGVREAGNGICLAWLGVAFQRGWREGFAPGIFTPVII